MNRCPYSNPTSNSHHMLLTVSQSRSVLFTLPAQSSILGNFTYGQFQDLECVTSHDRTHHPSHFGPENLECVSHMVPGKAQRPCSWTLAALRGWKHQDFWIGVLSHPFLIKMLLHHWKFLSVPNDFNPVIEPLVKTKSLGPKPSHPPKLLAFGHPWSHVVQMLPLGSRTFY